MKPFAAIVALVTGAAVLYGIVHDQITARICLEYFTIGHPRAFASNSPTLHGLYWGVVATWWAGLLAGLLIAAAARLGRWNKLTARHIWPLIVALLIVMAASATALGWLAHEFSDRSTTLDKPIARRGVVVPNEEQLDFIACAFAHAASYSVGFGGSVVIAFVIVVSRGVRARRRDRHTCG